jgi:predicted N-formylglutamate amidohydrolase
LKSTSTAPDTLSTQPYDLDPAFDYSIPFHAMRRHLPHLQIEYRQDEIAGAKGQAAWAQRLAAALSSLRTISLQS